MKKIIIIHLNPLIPRLKNAYLIESYFEAGFDVEYWDLRSIYNPSVTFPDELSEPYVYKFNFLGEVENRLAEIDKTKTIFVVQLHEIWYYRHLYRLLARYNCYMARINIYPADFRPALRDVNWRGFFYHVLRWGVAQTYFFYKKIYAYKTYRHYFAVSDTTINSINQRYYGINFNQPDYEVSINHPDYEIFRAVKDNPVRVVEGKYILFIDPFFPCHPEDVGLSRENQIAIDYHQRMRHFFDWLENRFQMPVVIAAHPSANYENDELGARKIIKYKTAELVKDAELVLLHQSNSNVFAILFDKPLVFLTTNGINQYNRLLDKISGTAGFLEKEVYNIDRCSYEAIAFSKIEKSVRGKYMYSYVTSPEAEGRRNKDIIIDEFEKIFEKLASF